MRKRYWFILFVVVALLFSAWGNVIAATFCPRNLLKRDCCETQATQPAQQTTHKSSCHRQMAGMEMNDMQMEAEDDSAVNSAQDTELTPESSSEELVLALPIAECAHCLGHSQPISGTAAVVTIDPSKRMVETNSLPANFANDLTAAFADLILPSEHSPPGPSSPRHLIINVFRI